MSTKTGFIGLGIMGFPMAKNILKAGYDLTVYNRSAEKAAPLVDLGAKTASSPKEIADQCDQIILMLSDPEAIEAVLEGPEGITASKNIKGKIFINMNTSSQVYIKKLLALFKRYSSNFIDAPVSGSKKPAEEGTLVILASGPKEKIDLVEPLLLTMGKKVIRCGNETQGTKMKMALNLLLGVMMEGLCEAIHLGEKSGISSETMMEAVLSGPLSCGLFEAKEEMMKSGDFAPQFPLKHMAKDLGFIMHTVNQAGAASPAGRLIFQLYRQGMSQNLGDQDFAAIKTVLDIMAEKTSDGHVSQRPARPQEPARPQTPARPQQSEQLKRSSQTGGRPELFDYL